MHLVDLCVDTWLAAFLIHGTIRYTVFQLIYVVSVKIAICTVIGIPVYKYIIYEISNGL